jgi:hypothetical protein
VSAPGVKLRQYWRAMSLGILLVIYAALSACGPTTVIAAPDPGQIIVKFKNADPKVKVAIGRVIPGGETASLDQGKLAFQKCGAGHTISVWAPGYAIQSLTCDGKLRGEYEISLEKLDSTDNANYPWAAADTRLDSIRGCAGCHSDASQLNEYSEWNSYGHSQAFVGSHFWTTYLGTNVSRMPGQETQWGFSLSGERFRLPPELTDPNKPYFGPGFQLDYPNASGNCAFCHAPATVGAAQQEVNLAPWIEGSWGERVNVGTEGVTCDVCHKVIGVSLDEQNLPYVDRPGILSFSFLRPMSGAHFVTGPWAHATAPSAEMKQTCVPIFSESSFCAPCHYAKFSGVEIYGSYKEWLDGPYSKPNQSFRSCQDCHMQFSQQIDGTASAARSACSPENHSFNEFSHNMMKRDDAGKSLLIEGAATVTVDAVKEDGKIKVNVTVVNTAAGHKLPTDSPLRHLILVVEARDENGRLLSQVEGPTIPDWGGKGTQPEDFAGRPGVIYGNILKDKDTNMVPAVAYWNPTVPAWDGSDTRLRPNEPVPSQYSFVVQSHGDVTVTAHLMYRDAFIDIVRQKGWPLRDILVNWDSDIVEE